jgi:hypothetical protein
MRRHPRVSEKWDGARHGFGSEFEHAEAVKPRRRGPRSWAIWAWLAGAGLSVLLPVPSHAQVLQSWTHKAAFSDASGAVAMGDTLMFVNDNEDEILGLYSRHPSASCKTAIYSFNARPSLGATGSDLSADLEAAVKRGDPSGTRIYWLGSMSNSKSGGLKPSRNRIFATQVVGNGSGSPPYSLTYVGRYDHLRDDILAWDQNNLHGLGANYFGLVASAADGVAAQRIDGFNAEGITITPGGATAYIAFRAPLVNGAGPTTSTSPRTHALIIPLLNMPSLVDGNPVPGPGAAHFGAPILLSLGGRGVRSIDCTRPGEYLITAGPYDAVSNPPVAPADFALYSWSGNPFDPPFAHATTFAATYSPEGCILPDEHITDQTIAQFINDDGGASCWRSMTCPIGAVLLDVPLPPRSPGGVRFTRSPAPNPSRHGVSFSITIPREQWVDLSIHDVAGRRLALLWHGNLPEGERVFSWMGEVPGEGRLRAGLYWVRLRAENVTEAKPFTLTP